MMKDTGHDMANRAVEDELKGASGMPDAGTFEQEDGGERVYNQRNPVGNCATDVVHRQEMDIGDGSHLPIVD